MLSEADDTEAFVDYCHRYRCSLRQECLNEFVAMHGVHQDAIVIQTDEVVVLRACCTVDDLLIRVLNKHLGQVDVDDKDVLMFITLWYY